MVDYIDLEFFQNYTRSTFDATTDPTDAQINLLISLSSAEIDELTGQTFGTTVGHTQYIENPINEELLERVPVLSITSVVDNNGNDVSYTMVDRDFIKLDKKVPVTITYDYGYTTPPVAVKMLTTLYTLQKVIQGGSSGADNTESISVGPISLSTGVGLSTVVNLDTDVKKYEQRVRNLVR